jgi:uncharacterized membrane protein
MKVVVPSKIAQYIFAITLGVFGVFHFMNSEGMAHMIPTWVPGGRLLVYLTGAAILAFSISFLTHKHARLAGYLMALYLFLVVLTVHLPTISTNEMAMGMILKDIALAMGCIAFANMADS